MKWAFHIFWVSFIISTVFIAPFLQHRSAKSSSDDLSILKSEISKKDDTIQIQNATIQSYQAENSTLHSKLLNIESANDPSAKAIKKRALILCKQLEEFYQQYHTNETALSDKYMRDFDSVRMKFGLQEPTNEVEKAAWIKNSQEAYSEVSAANNQARELFEAQWAAKFTVDYYGQLKVIRDELASLGLRDKELDLHIEQPFFTNVWFSQQLAMTIAYLANQIKE